MRTVFGSTLMDFETISPTKACELLGRHVAQTGLLGQRWKINKLAALMREEKWRVDPDSFLEIHQNGTVISGQHRLLATIVTDLPLTTYVRRVLGVMR
jgi:hypothetical protein